MTIDIARNSFDPKHRDWRAVLAQQGRVTLEADNNEQAAIAAEILQEETLDIIGPIGTPDGGYVVTAAGPDVQISHGTIYVGGLRFTQKDDIKTAAQPGWLDMPAWPTPNGNQTIALLAIAQSVTAVEDQNLKEVALGGPDSAGRLAYLQHFLRIPTTGTDCASAATALATTLKQQGLDYDSHTCALTSAARLQVTPVEPPTKATQCEPAVQGGYLGADNQMIRVAVTEYNHGTGKGTLVWGYNNASFLYRATLAAGNVITLLTTPLDPDHTPQAGQAVEILACTVDLGDGNPPSTAAGGNFIAAAEGAVMVLGSNPFNAANLQLTLPSNPGTPPGKQPFFVRLWNTALGFTAGEATPLGDTGLAVTITNPALPPIGGRPWWNFAARPSTPQLVYPQRYLTAGQPPEGPRQYLAPLGVVGVNSDRGFYLVEDCSVSFLPLTKLHDCSCCSLVLDPDKDWLTTLNNALSNRAITTLSVCFQPGAFTVPSKITVSGISVRMTGAGYGTVLTGASLEAVLEFDNCPDVSLSDFAVAAQTSGYVPANATVGLQGAITLRACNQIDIERLNLSCEGADIRSASCLAIYNPDTANMAPQTFNASVRNSRFEPGNSQVGILLVNADRAQVEGNVIVTPPASLGITFENLAQHPFVAFRLRKQLLHSMTLVDTAPPTTKKAKARLRKREAAKTPAAPDAAAGAKAPTKAAAKAAAAATPVKTAPLRAPAARVNLGAIGRAQIKASFGTIRLSFISSDKLTNAWTDALRGTALTATSRMGAIHQTVRALANSYVMKPDTAPTAFRSWIAATLPQLYSTSGQGIVVGGDFANDVRILNNTIDGTAQGIHVGLSNLKKDGAHPGHRLATRVQIKGNTVNIRISAQTTLDRHGIYLGCVTAGLVADNHLQLTRYPNANTATQSIDAIKIAGFFGQSLIVERNNMQGFSTGIYTAQDATSPPDNVLWIISENASDAQHQITGGNMFITQYNIP
jgi:hypothetical protein